MTKQNNEIQHDRMLVFPFENLGEQGRPEREKF
jgi:hypothetical protein